MLRLNSVDHRRMRWKNGKGETIEVAVEPPNATVDTFEWRVSMAAVVEDGPFSCFDGVDRTLAVLSGGELALRIAEAPPVSVHAAGPPLSFPADAPCEARLHGESVTDLNVMTRRGVWQHTLRRLPLAVTIAQSASAAVLVAAPDVATVNVEGVVVELGPQDALRLPAGCQIVLLAGTAWLAQFERATPQGRHDAP